MIYVTNNVDKLTKLIDVSDHVIVTNQQEFNDIGFNHDEVIEYLFGDNNIIKIPQQVFKLVNSKHIDNNVVLNHYVVLDKVIIGKRIANDIISNLKKQLCNFDLINNKLVIVQVGDIFASNVYIRNKMILAKSLGIKAELLKFDDSISEINLIAEINKLNDDDTVCAILVQAPLPKHINQNKISEVINPKKDIDCFNPLNLGKMFIKTFPEDIKPCTPEGCIRILDYYSINLESKNIVIVGRSNIVGKPLSILCLQKNATVTICHSKTKNLQDITKTADVLISAVGSAKLITRDYVKKGAICIDVGINHFENRLCGDFDFEDVYDVASYITPVPNGVGPMTLAILFENFLKLVKFKFNHVD